MKSLRVRLTLWVLVLFLVVQIVTAVVFYLYQRSTTIASFDDQLQARAAGMASSVSRMLPSLKDDETLQRIASEESRYLQRYPFRITIVAHDGKPWTPAAATWPAETYELALKAITSGVPQFETVRADWFASEGGYRSARVVAQPIMGSAGRPFALLVATSDEHVREQASLVTRVFVVAGVVALFATAVSGWYIAGVAIRPLEQLKRLAHQISPQSMKFDLPAESSSEAKQLAAALDAAQSRIRVAFQAQERFLSNISHEIKTPIATLLVEAQTIDRSSLSRPAAQFVRTTEEEMRRLGRLVESFLTLTRVKDGKGLERMTRVPVNELVLDCVARCAPMARQYAVRLRPSLIEDDDYIDAVVSGEPELLRTMLDNLIRNAIRFTPREGSVHVASSIRVGMVELCVEDEGPGLPPELIANVFDRFVQAPDEQRKGRGHGLGLAIAQGIAEMHSGRIEASNLPGGGARFVAVLPLGGPTGTLQEPARESQDASVTGTESAPTQRGDDLRAK